MNANPSVLSWITLPFATQGLCNSLTGSFSCFIQAYLNHYYQHILVCWYIYDAYAYNLCMLFLPLKINFNFVMTAIIPFICHMFLFSPLEQNFMIKLFMLVA